VNRRASICACAKATGRTATTTCRATRPRPLPVSGAFSIDRDDYRLNGNVASADLRVLLDVLNVKDDQDGFFTGDGDIYVEYTVSNGKPERVGPMAGVGHPLDGRFTTPRT
jgi:hypothetical protein